MPRVARLPFLGDQSDGRGRAFGGPASSVSTRGLRSTEGSRRGRGWPYSVPWDGSLTCEVTLVSPWPGELTWSKEWWRDRGWRDWPQLFGQYVPPSEQDLTRSPHLRAMLLVQAPVPLDDLPAAPDGPNDELEQSARRAISVLVRELDELFTPMIGQLEAGVPAGS
jgi:hypothetical protein